ncbi:MAG: FHA domain-containing protein, partial [Aggregatilineales bacterium]
RVVGTPSFIKVNMRENLLIGRGDPDNNIHPEINVDPYDAQSSGVSRRHAHLIAKDNRVTIQDLNSSNGTFINQRRLRPGRNYRLRDGDTLHLGKMELQVHFILKPIKDDGTVVGGGNALGIPQIGEGRHVLVLDSDEHVCRVLKRFVGFANFNVTVTHAAGEALAIIEENTPDMLIIELALQDTSGIDVIRYIRGLDIEKYIPIMAISESTGGYYMRQALQEGADMFLGKPVSLEELIEGLEGMVAWMQQKKP